MFTCLALAPPFCKQDALLPLKIQGQILSRRSSHPVYTSPPQPSLWSHKEKSFPLCVLANRDDNCAMWSHSSFRLCVLSFCLGWKLTFGCSPTSAFAGLLCWSCLLFKLPLCITQTSPTQTASVYQQVVCGVCRCRCSLAEHCLIFMQESSYCTNCRLTWFWGEKWMWSNALSKGIFVKLWLLVKIWYRPMQILQSLRSKFLLLEKFIFEVNLGLSYGPSWNRAEVIFSG